MRKRMCVLHSFGDFGLTLFYFRTKDTFIDGWVRTGDEVMINENSELFVLDRVKVLQKDRLSSAQGNLTTKMPLGNIQSSRIPSSPC